MVLEGSDMTNTVGIRVRTYSNITISETYQPSKITKTSEHQ